MNEPDIYITKKHGQLFTTSLDVAEKFGKRHKDVLKSIRKIIEGSAGVTPEPKFRLWVKTPGRKIAPGSTQATSKIEGVDSWGLHNFVESSYLDEQIQRRPMFLMTRSGFSILAMGFTGKAALEWKIRYESAFSAMEQALLNQQNLSWQQARSQGKLARREETDVVAAFVEYAKRQGSTHAAHYFSLVTNMTYSALFLVSKASPRPFRDLLDSLQLIYLAAAESIVQQALEDGMAQVMNYRDIYPLARLRVEAYAATLPRKRLSVASPRQALIRLHQQAA